MEKRNYRVIILSISLIFTGLIAFLTACDNPTEVLRVYELTIETDGNGTTIPTGVVEVNKDIPRDVLAEPDPGYYFGNWEVMSGRGVEFGNQGSASTTVTLNNGDATIRANFTAEQYLLTVTSDGNGTVIPKDSVYVNHGQARDISAFPADGYDFANWTTGSAGVTFGNPNHAKTTVTLISGDATIQANFRLSGVSVAIDQPYINSSNAAALSFILRNAEVGATYIYSVDDANGSTPAVTGSGMIVTATVQVASIDVNALDDGILTLTVYLTDTSGNQSDFSDIVIKDTVLPIFISVDDGGGDNTYMPGETITFDVVLDETGLTVTADLSVLDSAFSSTQTLTDDGDNTYSLTTAALASGTMAEGTDIAVTFSATDTAGNTNTDNSLTFLLDKTPPGGNFVINNGNRYTVSDSVTLTMTISGAAEMRFGNTADERDSAAWDEYSASKAWTLSPCSEVKTVYGEFRDAVGNTYQTDDTIHHNKLVASDGTENDLFGYSVAMSADGSIVVVGAYKDDDNDLYSGSVYVYSGTNFSTETKLTASDSAGYDHFGVWVAVSSDGSIIVVGAYLDDDNGQNSGSVYVYSGTNWDTEVKLTANDGAEDNWFGSSVSVSSDGSIIVVGAYYGVEPGSGQGSVYVYSGTNWGTETKLTASDSAANDYFGRNVAVSSDGSIIVVGATGDDDNGSSSGSVYVYSGTNWGTETKLTASDGTADDFFGVNVAVSADNSIIVVGAPGDDDNGPSSGSVYVYSDINWAMETKLTASDGRASDYFGINVSESSDGTIIAVGTSNNANDANSVYVFSGTNWGTETKLSACDWESGDRFGFSVAVSSDGSIIIVGSYRDNDNGENSGSVYLFPLW